METVTVVLLLLAAVVASSIISRAAPFPLPLPLVQIALGASIAAAFDFRIALDPEVFLLLFIAPLLFLDSWRIPKEGLYRDRWTIIALAVGLVVFTVVVAGYFIHWLIPVMPLPIAFALAAVLSPTDAVSVSAITSRTPLPKRLMHILEGEALLNDASGLVCMRFAVAAALTGTFSIVDATKTFAWLAIAGIVIGGLLAFVANAAKDFVAKRFGEETGSQILISLLIPFAAYVVAEHFHASGILASVAAGIVMGYEERSGRASAITRIRRTAVWSAVQFAGNGVIFVLLGQQLPNIIAGAGKVVQETGHESELRLVALILAIAWVLAALRFLWVWATLRLILFRAARQGVRNVPKPDWRIIAVTSLAGVRGAVTLAGIMTLPLVLQDGSAFPTRDLAILLAAGTIVVSLLGANIGLPYLTNGLKLPPEALSRREEEDEARLAAAQAAIDAVEHAVRIAEKEERDADLYMQVGTRIVTQYRDKLETWSNASKDGDVARKVGDIERGLRLIAINAERLEYYRFARSGLLSDESIRRLVREADLLETRFRPA